MLRMLSLHHIIRCRDKPPLSRNQPPVAGAITWSRSLFARIKQTMSKLHTVEDEVMGLDLGREVHRQYTSFAKQVMTYEKILYKQWIANIDSSAMLYLKMNILCLDPDSGKVLANFSKGLVKLMRETRYLDRMGLDIPEIALNVTLQEESYSKCVTMMPTKRTVGSRWRCDIHLVAMQARRGLAAYASIVL